MIIGTKSDLIYDRQVSSDKGRQLADRLDCLFLETSAKYNFNVEEAFVALVRTVLARSKPVQPLALENPPTSKPSTLPAAKKLPVLTNPPASPKSTPVLAHTMLNRRIAKTTPVPVNEPPGPKRKPTEPTRFGNSILIASATHCPSNSSWLVTVAPERAACSYDLPVALSRTVSLGPLTSKFDPSPSMTR